MDVEVEAAILFITNMNARSIAEFIAAQNKAIDGLTDNNQQLRKEYRKIYTKLLKLKDSNKK